MRLGNRTYRPENKTNPVNWVLLVPNQRQTCIWHSSPLPGRGVYVFCRNHHETHFTVWLVAFAANEQAVIYLSMSPKTQLNLLFPVQ